MSFLFLSSTTVPGRAPQIRVKHHRPGRGSSTADPGRAPQTRVEHHRPGSSTTNPGREPQIRVEHHRPGRGSSTADPGRAPQTRVEHHRPGSSTTNPGWAPQTRVEKLSWGYHRNISIIACPREMYNIHHCKVDSLHVWHYITSTPGDIFIKLQLNTRILQVHLATYSSNCSSIHAYYKYTWRHIHQTAAQYTHITSTPGDIFIKLQLNT